MERRLLYSDRYFDVVGLGAGDADGSFLASRPAVAVVAIDDDGGWWFVREPAPAAASAAIVAVTGVVEGAETPTASADRELREELGRAAGRLVHVGTIRPWVKYLDLTVDVCAAIGLRADDSGAVGDEAVAPQPVRYTPEEFDAAMVSGEIVDGMTIAAVALVRRWLADSAD